MTSDNLIIAAVVGVLALLVSGVVAAGGRARDALPSAAPNPQSSGQNSIGVGEQVVATANGYQIRRMSDGRYAVIAARRGEIGRYDTVSSAASVANSRDQDGNFARSAAPADAPQIDPQVVNEWTSDTVRPDIGDGRAGGVDDAPTIPDAGEGSPTGLDDTFDADRSSGSFLRDEDQSVDDYRAEFTSNLLSDELINEVEG